MPGNPGFGYYLPSGTGAQKIWPGNLLKLCNASTRSGDHGPPGQTVRPRQAQRVSLEKAGGLSEADRLSFRPPSDMRYAVVVCHRIYDALTALLPSFRLLGKAC